MELLAKLVSILILFVKATSSSSELSSDTGCSCETARLSLGRRADIDQQLEYPLLIGRCAFFECLWIVDLDLSHVSPYKVVLGDTGEMITFILPSDFRGNLSVFTGPPTQNVPLKHFRCTGESTANVCAGDGVTFEARASTMTLVFQGGRTNKSASAARIIILNEHGKVASDDLTSFVHWLSITLLIYGSVLCLIMLCKMRC